jgi:lipooligosaccharide transport system permease protein
MSTPMAVRSFEYWLVRYRRTWFSGLVVSFASPLLFLVAMGMGLGRLVDAESSSALDGASYAAFIAPGLLAAAAMQTAAGEATWPVLGALKWQRTYYAMLGTPLRPFDVMLGHLAWMATRVLLSAVAFFAVMLLFALPAEPLAVLAVPAALLTGGAFAAPLMGISATFETDTPFALIWRLGIMPMFVLSGTFFPVEQLPGWLRGVAYATPLWHGVDLCRDIVLGTATAGSTAVHVGYLAALSALGVLLAAHTYRRRLSS